MHLSLQVILSLIVVIFLLVILNHMRKDRLTLQYSLVWIVAALVLLLCILFPGILSGLSEWVGVEVPSNFVFMVEGVFVLVILISLTKIVSKQRRQIIRLAQQIALLEKRLRELEKGDSSREEP